MDLVGRTRTVHHGTSRRPGGGCRRGARRALAGEATCRRRDQERLVVHARKSYEIICATRWPGSGCQSDGPSSTRYRRPVWASSTRSTFVRSTPTVCTTSSSAGTDSAGSRQRPPDSADDDTTRQPDQRGFDRRKVRQPQRHSCPCRQHRHRRRRQQTVRGARDDRQWGSQQQVPSRLPGGLRARSAPDGTPRSARPVPARSEADRRRRVPPRRGRCRPHIRHDRSGRVDGPRRADERAGSCRLLRCAPTRAGAGHRRHRACRRGPHH